MTSPEEIVVLAGGLSAERDVSLRSGRRLADALRHLGFGVTVLDLDAGLLSTLASTPCDCVVPMVHGAAGEDGSLAEVLEVLGMPYVGSRPLACRIAFDKAIARGLAEELGVCTPAGFAIPQETFRDLGAPALMDALSDRLGLPMMVKPTRGGSALGASLVTSADGLSAALVGAFAYGESALLEEYVSGTEIAISVVDLGDGPRTWPAVEIVPASGIYDYAARYTAGQTEFFTPARLDESLLQAASRAALAVFERLGLRDWARADFVVRDGDIYFLEMNVVPGMTETSLFPQAAAAAGTSVGEAAAEIIRRRCR